MSEMMDTSKSRVTMTEGHVLVSAGGGCDSDNRDKVTKRNSDVAM